MRHALLPLILATAASVAVAQDNTIAVPRGAIANYDPTMSAKEAVLANWELASAGIRAGRVVGEQVLALAAKDVPYPALARQAQFAQKTMVQRYNAALWVYTDGSGVDALADPAALTQAVGAAFATCAAEPCTAERAAIQASFQRATDELNLAAIAANSGLTDREDLADKVLMSEQLGLVAEFLASGDWAADLTLTEFGRDGEEVAARIVGAVALWNNVEPYVGLTSPEIDTAINAAARELLRTLRKVTREGGVLKPGGPELTAIDARAQVLAAEFRRAAALFSS